MKNANKTFVLVHGAWHGAWSYDKVISALIASGAKVLTVELPGHGKDKTPINGVSMAGYVQKVKETMGQVEEPVVLVGHSLAGFIIAQVAEDMPDRVAQLVFIASMIPYEDKTAFDIISTDSESQLLENLIFAEDKSWATVSEATLNNIVYNKASAAQIREAAPQLVQQAAQPFFARVETSEAAFGTIDKTYIVCENDKIFSPNAQRALIQRIGIHNTLTLNTGHVPHVENPAALAQAILAA